MLILLSLMVILCSFTVISASDVNDAVDDSILTDSNGENIHNQEAVLTDANSIGSSEIKAIQKKDNSKNLKTEPQKGTFKQLQELIDDADESSTIYLEKDYLNIHSDDIVIKKPITIDGQGHTLDANRENRIFDIKADNVILRNMTLTNSEVGHLHDGATIYWGGKNGLIENSIIKYAYTRSSLMHAKTKCLGGGIYVNGEHLTIRNCEFNHLQGKMGGALYLNSKNNVIDKCSFTYNYFYYEDYTMPSGFDGRPMNIAARYDYNIGGGAIYVDNTGNTIKDSYFAYNLAQEGGAIYLNRANNVIDSCIFLDNRARINGGAIYVDARDNNISNNIFYLNNMNDNLKSLSQLREIDYDDIYSTVTFSVDNNWWGNINRDILVPLTSELKDKDAKPITNNIKVIVNNWYYIDVVDQSNNTIPKEITRIGDFVGNTFDLKIMFKLNNGTGNFNYPYFENYFTLHGDKLSLLDGDKYTKSISRRFEGDSIAFSMLTNNPESVLTFGNGMIGAKAIFRFKKTYPLSRLQNIIDNVWENDSAYIYDTYKYDPDVDADMVNGITVNKTITIDGKGATIDLDHKTRGFYVTADNVMFKNITIKNAKAYNGAAITFTGDGGTVDNSTFQSNFAETNGGAIYSYGEDAFINNSVFDRNYAADKGAALYSNGKFFRYSNNIFTNNQAKTGQSVCVEGPYYSLFSGWDNNTYENNSYLDYGGNADYTIKPHIIRGMIMIVSINPIKSPNKKTITTSNNKEIPLNNNQLTLGVLNQIFNQNFTNGHLLVYIDGKLVFNATTTDDLSQLIYNLINLLTGKHEIKVEFKDSEGNTNTYTESITV